MNERFKELNKMALPVLITSIGNMIFVMADEAIIGRTSIDGLAAVSLVAKIIYMITGSLGIFTVAFGIYFARAVGDKYIIRQQRLFSTTLSISMIIGFFINIIGLLFGNILLKGIYDLKGETYIYAIEYLIIGNLGLLLNLMIFVFSCFWKNMRKTRLTMMANLIGLVLNFLADYSLVFGKFNMPKLGPIGAAYGTVIGVFIEFFILLIFFIKEKKLKLKVELHFEELREILRTYIPLLLQDLVECTIFVMIIMAIITRIGVIDMAAYGILENIGMIIVMPAFGYGGVALTLYLQERRNKGEKFLSLGFVLSMVIGVVIALIMAIFPRFILSIFTNKERLIVYTLNLIVLGIISGVFNIGNQCYKIYLQGMEEGKFTFYLSVAFYGITSILSYVLGISLGYGLKGVYISLILMNLALYLGYYWRYKRVIMK